jgi:hypothetical protein
MSLALRISRPNLFNSHAQARAYQMKQLELPPRTKREIFPRVYEGKHSEMTLVHSEKWHEGAVDVLKPDRNVAWENGILHSEIDPR